MSSNWHDDVSIPPSEVMILAMRCGVSWFGHNSYLLKQGQFGVSNCHIENAWKRWHGYVFCSPSELTRFWLCFVDFSKFGAHFLSLFWSPSHLEFCLKSLDHFLSSPQVTWLPNPKCLRLMTWDILGHSVIIICFLFLLKCMYVTFYGMFYNICTKSSQHFVRLWIMCSMSPAPTALPFKTYLWVAMVLHSVMSQ